MRDYRDIAEAADAVCTELGGLEGFAPEFVLERLGSGGSPAADADGQCAAALDTWMSERSARRLERDVVRDREGWSDRRTGLSERVGESSAAVRAADREKTARDLLFRRKNDKILHALAALDFEDRDRGNGEAGGRAPDPGSVASGPAGAAAERAD